MYVRPWLRPWFPGQTPFLGRRLLLPRSKRLQQRAHGVRRRRRKLHRPQSRKRTTAASRRPLRGRCGDGGKPGRRRRGAGHRGHLMRHERLNECGGAAVGRMLSRRSLISRSARRGGLRYRLLHQRSGKHLRHITLRCKRLRRRLRSSHSPQ